MIGSVVADIGFLGCKFTDLAFKFAPRLIYQSRHCFFPGKVPATIAKKAVVPGFKVVVMAKDSSIPSLRDSRRSRASPEIVSRRHSVSMPSQI